VKDGSKKIFPDFMAKRLANICYFKELIEQEMEISSSKTLKDKTHKTIIQKEEQNDNSDSSTMPTSSIR